MDAPLTADVLAVTAVGLLCGLEADGFRVALTADGALVIAPRSRLTPDRMTTIAAHKDALRLILRDAGVQARREAFRAQLNAAPAPSVPAFLFRADVPYTRGLCFSCGDGLPELRFSRCWRCSLAWRLACRLPISSDLATVIDSARRVA